MKYSRLVLYKIEVYLVHSSGDSRAWQCHQLSSGKDFMVDGIIMMNTHAVKGITW
jgi:hypothetical protein